MKERDPIEQLKKVQRVETPDFLWTRIQSKIEDVVPTKMPLSWALGLGFSIALLIVVNIISVSSYQITNTNSIESNSNELIEYVGGNQSQQLYHE